MDLSPRLKYIGLSVLLVIASINFTRTTVEIMRSSRRLDDVKTEISSLEQQKVTLEDSIEYKSSSDFIEKTARNELNMAKKGESVYVISGINEDKAEVLAEVAGDRFEKKTLTMRTKNLKLWWNLLF